MNNKIVVSSLTRKVFDQISCPQNVDWAWWIEQKLQKMQINGLVKMIQQSKKMDMKYIEGYLPKFKWAFRKNSINISHCDWLFCFIQSLDVDFNWNIWEQLVQIKTDDMKIFQESMNIAFSRNNSNLNYILAIFFDKRYEFYQKIEELRNNITSFEEEEKKEITDKSIQKWNNLKDLLC